MGSRAEARGHHQSRRLRLAPREGRGLGGEHRWRCCTRPGHGERSARASAGPRPRLRNKSAEDYLPGLRLWLESKPAGESWKEYDAFVRKHAGELDGTRLVASGTIRQAMPVTREEILAAERGKKAPERAAADHAKATGTTLEGALVGLTGVARLLGVSVPTARNWTRREDFPRTAAVISGHAAWLANEICAYGRRQSFELREPFALQTNYIDAEDMIEILEVGGKGPLAKLRRWVRDERFEKVPPAEGDVAIGRLYWRREMVEAWLEAREGEQAEEPPASPAAMARSMSKWAAPTMISRRPRRLYVAGVCPPRGSRIWGGHFRTCPEPSSVHRRSSLSQSARRSSGRSIGSDSRTRRSSWCPVSL